MREFLVVGTDRARAGVFFVRVSCERVFAAAPRVCVPGSIPTEVTGNDFGPPTVAFGTVLMPGPTHTTPLLTQSPRGASQKQALELGPIRGNSRTLGEWLCTDRNWPRDVTQWPMNLKTGALCARTCPCRSCALVCARGIFRVRRRRQFARDR